MMRHFFRHTAAQIIFIVGLLTIILGIGFLLGTMYGISQVSILTSFVFIIIGAFFAILAVYFDKRTIYLFLACFFILIGIFLFLSAMQILPFTLAQGWPLLSIFAGLALLPAGWRYYQAIRYHYLIPCLAFVGLGSSLLIFSFQVVPFSFRRFVIDWWPLVLVITGLILVLLSLGPKKANFPRKGEGE